MVKNFFKALLFSALLFALYYYICPLVFSSLLINFIKSNNYWLSNFSYLLVYLLTFLIIILIVHKDLIEQFKEFKQNPSKVLNKGFTYWIYGIIVMVISNLICTTIVGGIASNEELTRESIINNPIYIIPLVICFGPILEEIIFRYGLRKGFTKEKNFMLFSAFIFGALHIISGLDSYSISNLILHLKDWLFIIPYGALGFFFAKAYFETDNIFASIIPHMLHNTLSVALILISSLF